jgi:hypothetical protein
MIYSKDRMWAWGDDSVSKWVFVWIHGTHTIKPGMADHNVNSTPREGQRQENLWGLLAASPV